MIAVTIRDIEIKTEIMPNYVTVIIATNSKAIDIIIGIIEEMIYACSFQRRYTRYVKRKIKCNSKHLYLVWRKVDRRNLLWKKKRSMEIVAGAMRERTTVRNANTAYSSRARGDIYAEAQEKHCRLVAVVGRGEHSVSSRARCVWLTSRPSWPLEGGRPPGGLPITRPVSATRTRPRSVIPSSTFERPCTTHRAVASKRERSEDEGVTNRKERPSVCHAVPTAREIG